MNVQIPKETKEALADVIKEVIPNIKNIISFDELLNYATQGD